MTTRDAVKKLGGSGFMSENVGACWVAGCTDRGVSIQRTGATRDDAERALVERMRMRSMDRQFAA